MTLFKEKSPYSVTTYTQEWETPKMMRHPIVLDWLEAPHLLIAGSSGSGKSVLLNLLIHDIMGEFPGRKQMILIDPKRVELVQFKCLPHTMRYASEREEMLSALDGAVWLMEERYKEMQSQGLRKYQGGDIYVIVDEYADLIVTDKKRVEPLVLRLAQMGRASRIHLILCTQRPTRDIITGSIKVNIDHRFALHVPTAQDSRNIMGVNGAESLPMYGQAYYYSPSGIELYEIPMMDEAEMDRLVKHWEAQVPADKMREKQNGSKKTWFEKLFRQFFK